MPLLGQMPPLRPACSCAGRRCRTVELQLREGIRRDARHGDAVTTNETRRRDTTIPSGGRDRPGADQLSDLLGRAPGLRAAAPAEPAPAEPEHESPSPAPVATGSGHGGERLPSRRRRASSSPEATHTQANATHPRLLWRLARTAAKAGLGIGPDGALPVQRYVQKQEQAALATQLRASSRLVAGVVGQVMRLESELRGAEGRLHDAGVHLDELTEHHRAALATVAKRRAAAVEQLEPRPRASLERRAP